MSLRQTQDSVAFVIISCKDRGTPRLFASLGSYERLPGLCGMGLQTVRVGTPNVPLSVSPSACPDAERRHDIAAS